jgi:hypothetical protein
MKYIVFFILLSINYSINPYSILETKSYYSIEKIKEDYNKKLLVSNNKEEMKEAMDYIISHHWIKEGDDYYEKLTQTLFSYLFLCYFFYRLKCYSFGLLIILKFLYSSFGIKGYLAFKIYDYFIDEYIQDESGYARIAFVLFAPGLIKNFFTKKSKLEKEKEPIQKDLIKQTEQNISKESNEQSEMQHEQPIESLSN